MATKAELIRVGRENGEVLAASFVQIIAPYGEAIPDNILEIFWEGQKKIVQNCMQQLAAGGLSPAEIDIWFEGMRAAVKEHHAAFIGAKQ